MHPEKRLHLMASAIIYEYQDLVRYSQNANSIAILNARFKEATNAVVQLLGDRLQLDFRKQPLLCLLRLPWVLWISWVVTQKIEYLMLDALAIADGTISENIRFVHEFTLEDSSGYQESKGIKAALVAVANDLLQEML